MAAKNKKPDSPTPPKKIVTTKTKVEENITIKIASFEQNISRTEMNSWIKENSTLSFRPNYFSEIENIYFCRFKHSISCQLSFGSIKERNIGKKSEIMIDENAIVEYVQNLAKKANREPEDAKLKIENGKVSAFSLSSPGITLEEDEAKEIIKNYLRENSQDKTIELPYSETKADVAIDSIDNMGITTLIGEGKSNFRGSPRNRIFNINVATKRFNGVLIKPGEEFSFVKVLGEVDGDHGYLPELVIKKDKTEPEFGGGICQVSTTAFRAAINSGLEITARRNHAYPVSYYNPQGMDATVYVPRPDLRFINDTPSYILIQTKIEGTELIFDFYGTDDDRKTEVIGPKVLERNPDGSMKTTFTQKVTDKDGDILREDVFNSSYDSPNKYPHPGTTSDVLTQKPNGWSDNEWKDYKKAHNL